MLELKNVSYKINKDGQEIYILKNISCVFDDNSTIAITGHNGSGKSTLTKIIMGIIPLSSGQILFNGKDITNSSIDERAKMGLNYAFQQPVHFVGITIISENPVYLLTVYSSFSSVRSKPSLQL